MKLTTSPFPPGAVVVAYLRDSGGDSQNLSIAEQREMIQHYCRENGLVLSQLFCDEASPGSSVTGRDEFHRMMGFFHNGGQAAGLLIWSSSRFARNINDAQFYKSDLRRRGIIIHSLTDAIPDGIAGQLVEFALTWKDEIFLEQLSGDVRRGLAYIVRQYGAVPGRPPVGFMRVPVDVGIRRDGTSHVLHRWEPDPAMIGLVQQAFTMRARGATLRQVMDATGLYTSVNSWVTFFANPIYCGRLEYGDLVIDDYCAPIVSTELWQTAQDVGRARAISQGGADHPRRVASPYLLSGLVYCQVCGSPMMMHTVDSREYYQCARSRRRHDCPSRYIPRQPFEQAVLDCLHNEILTVQNLETIQGRLQREYSQNITALSARRAELTRQIGVIKKSIKNLLAAIKSAGHSQAIMDELHQLESDHASAVLDLDALDDAMRAPVNHSHETLAEIATSIQASLSLPAETLRPILRGFVTRIIVTRNDDSISGLIEYIPPSTLGGMSGRISGLWGGAPRGMPAIGHKFFVRIKPHKAPRPMN